MCDWGGGPNEIHNYRFDNREEPKISRTVRCLRPNCNMLIEGYSRPSMTYWEWDPVMMKHLKEVHGKSV